MRFHGNNNNNNYGVREMRTKSEGIISHSRGVDYTIFVSKNVTSPYLHILKVLLSAGKFRWTKTLRGVEVSSKLYEH